MTTREKLHRLSLALGGAALWTGVVSWLFGLGPTGTLIAAVIALYVAPAATADLLA